MNRLRSGQVAHAAGLNQQTLRYYERRGLLAAPDRTPGGHRLYPAETLTVLRVIKAAQRLGFSLDEVADLLETGRHQHRNRPDAGLRQRAAAKLAEVKAKIADLTAIADTLRAALDARLRRPHGLRRAAAVPAALRRARPASRLTTPAECTSRRVGGPGAGPRLRRRPRGHDPRLLRSRPAVRPLYWRISWQLAYRVSGPDHASGDDPGIQSAQPQLAADPGVDEPQRISTEPGGELGAAEVRLVSDLYNRRAQGQPGSRWQVGRAQVEVDVKLITGQHAPVRGPGDEQGSTGVHHGHLHIRVWRAVGGTLASSHRPGIASQAGLHIEHGRREHLTLVNSGRRTISSTVPPSDGESRTSPRPASSAAVLRCSI